MERYTLGNMLRSRDRVQNRHGAEWEGSCREETSKRFVKWEGSSGEQRQKEPSNQRQL